MTQGTYRSPIRPPPDDILGIILLLTENSGMSSGGGLLEEPAFRPPVFHTQQLSKPFISHAQRIFKYQYNIPLIQDSSNQLFSNKIIV